jgi:hypothetical protein
VAVEEHFNVLTAAPGDASQIDLSRLVAAMGYDATWSALAAELDTQQLMDVVFTVGAYETVAMAFRAFGIELDADLERK